VWFQAQVTGHREENIGCREWGLEFMVSDVGNRIQGVGCQIQGIGCRVKGVGYGV
jgi:hypothetical protein